MRDVTLRDGLQSEPPLEPAVRADLARSIAAAGVREIEAVSFVSPSAVPAMQGAAEVAAALVRDGTMRNGTMRDGTMRNGSMRGGTMRWWALVPNRRGVELALAAGFEAITVTVSASDAYSRKNLHRGTAEALAALGDIVSAAAGPASTGDAGTTDAAGPAIVDIVVSCAFGSPFDDVTSPAVVRETLVAVAQALSHAGHGARLTLADTTGTATPRRIDDVLAVVPDELRDDLGLHLHDSRGLALANALHGIRRGITRFDTSLGGLGGSPFAPGAGGNLPTEALVAVADDLGMTTGIDAAAVLDLAASMAALVGHPLASRMVDAGPLERFEA